MGNRVNASKLDGCISCGVEKPYSAVGTQRAASLQIPSLTHFLKDSTYAEMHPNLIFFTWKTKKKFRYVISLGEVVATCVTLAVMTEVQNGFLAALAASAIWGGMYVISRVVLEVIPPLPLVALRMLISALAIFGLYLVLRRNWQIPKSAWTRVAIMGIVGYVISISAQFIGTKLAGAALGSLITTASPLFTVAIAAIFGLEKVALRAWVGLALGMVAVYLLSGVSGGGDATGALWLVLAAFTWGVLGVVGGQTVAKLDAFAVTAWASLIGFIGTSALIPFETSPIRFEAINLPVILGILYLGIVSTAVAFALWVYGVSRAGSVLSGIAFFAQPVVGSLLGALLLKEQLNSSFVLAAGLLFLGAWLARPAPTQQQKTTE
jgi:drug/metabolite transporter (DMT)-like permease